MSAPEPLLRVKPRRWSVEPLTPEAFAPYGQVLLQNPEDPEPFQALFTEPASRGWRVAILKVNAGPLTRLHRHPDSHECFAPLSGRPALAVADPGTPETFRIFLLEQPVCVYHHVWHEMVSLTPQSRIFIAENAEISGEAIPFETPLEFGDSSP